MTERLKQQMEFIIEADKVKNIFRQNYLADGTRRENDAEHSWHLALMAVLLKEYGPAEADLSRVIPMVLIHDLVEIDAGDTYAYDEAGAATKAERETKAANRLFSLLPKDQGRWFRELWEEFEAYETPDAKYAHMLDNCQPLLLNDASQGKSWMEHQVRKSQIYGRNRKTGEGSMEIWDYMKDVVDKNIELGHVIDDENGDETVDEWVMERFSLAKERVREAAQERIVQEPFGDFFRRTAEFLCRTAEVFEEQGRDASLEELKARNAALYEDILPENYENSYGNPACAAKKLGEYGQAFCFLYAELRGAVVYAFEKKLWDLTTALELFLEVYASFEEKELPSVQTVREILRSYVNDYCQDMILERTEEIVNPECDFALRIVMDSDLSDLRYLYRYGEYVSVNETGVAEFLGSLPQEQVDAMARTFTEGYRMGFVNGRKDLSKKKTVNIRYRLGFERMVRAAVLQFEQMGLRPVLSRYASHAVNKRGQLRSGYTGAIANPQYDYDHRQDAALFLDSDFVQKKLRFTQQAYEEFQEAAGEMGGPACIETFGENPFEPVSRPEALSLSEEQQKLLVEMDSEISQIANRYIRREEGSFTIIAYPLPEIGEQFPEIFREIVRINTLDGELYGRIQQTMIDAVNGGQWAEVKGAGDNETDLRIRLHPISDPSREVIFENCMADVNIPVGEIFTSPVLSGTSGLLHVKKVYLNGLLFRDLKLWFKDGLVEEYSCGNFEREEENRRYIEDNILFHHEKLPMGEFAIGTNTTAYVAAQKYDIAARMPILIAEKMGPHFAVGDTCYSWAEDVPVFNPDGRECVARDNEISLLRRTDPGKAYFGCHTDITIPYEELDSICVIDGEGNRVPVIEGGRFVLPGTEELNRPFA